MSKLIERTEAERLLVLYLTNEICAADMDTLILWMTNPENRMLFYKYIEIGYAIQYNMSDYDTEKTKNSVLIKIQSDKRKKYRLNLKKNLKYVAMAVLFLGIGVFFYKYSFTDVEQPSNQSLVQWEETITLELDDGSVRIIPEDANAVVRDSNGNRIGNQTGGQIVYDTATVVDGITYNTLTVPYGKKFDISLSDGTRAVLNSGSSLRYPVQFLEEGNRRVFLKGEAFLDVMEDGNRPFIVNAGDLNIRVLGTKFNVSTYPEDVLTEVVLVDGTVGLYERSEVYDNKNSIILSPGSKGSYDKAKTDISVRPVKTSIYTSWIDGGLVFRNSTFDAILKKMERHYNVTIINENKVLSNEKFNASFADEPVERILNYFEVTYGIDYSINNKFITIN